MQGIVTNYRDVTERKLSEERIRSQAMLLNQTSDAIILRDVDDVIRFWSKGAERVYGWLADEVLGKPITAVVTDDGRSHQAASEAVRMEERWTGELTHHRKDGAAIAVLCRWTLLRNASGAPQSILSIHTDVTEKKKLEEQLLRTQRMESIGALAGGIAHDLNNILSPILLCIGKLKRDAADRATRETLELLETSAKRGAQMVKQVLAFGRGVQGEALPVQPLQIAKEVGQIIRETFPRSIHFSLQCGHEPWTIKGNPTQLHQIVMNLCVNARDAMPNGGFLSLELRNTTLDASDSAQNPAAVPGPYLVIKVTDTGSGIPTAIRERIFEPFFTTKDFDRGSGLGLSTVLSIAKSHGGFVRLESVVGSGTTFEVFLPARAMSADPLPAPIRC